MFHVKINYNSRNKFKLRKKKKELFASVRIHIGINNAIFFKTFMWRQSVPWTQTLRDRRGGLSKFIKISDVYQVESLIYM